MLNANIEKLVGSENFITWTNQVNNLMIINELWGYIQGTVLKLVPTPNPTDPTNPILIDPIVLATFNAIDEIVVVVLHLIVSDNIDQNIQLATSSKEAHDC